MVHFRMSSAISKWGFHCYPAIGTLLQCGRGTGVVIGTRRPSPKTSAMAILRPYSGLKKLQPERSG